MSRKKKIVPKLRFEDFENHPDWSLTELRNLSTLITKGTTPKDKSGKGSINFIKVENIDKESGEITSVSKVSSAEHNGYLKRSKLYEDDILFSIAGTLGRIATVDKRILPANTNQALAIIRLNEGNLDYIKTYLKGKSIIDYIKNNPTVGAQPNLSLEQVGNFKVTFPTEYEQEKIGSFFKKIDKMIQLQKSKVNKIKDIKSAYLSEMFPKKGEEYPKKRFGGFIEPWKKYKLTDIATFLKGRGLARKDMVENGQYECILYGHLYTVYGMVIDNIIYKTNTINQNMITSQKGDVLIPSSDTTPTGLARASSLEKDDIILGGDINILRPNRNIDGSFLSYNINANRSQLLKLIKGTTVKHIYNDDLKDVLVRVPEKEEQKLIVDLFRNIDNQIAIEEEKLTKLEKLKQAYLNDMFV